MPKLHTIKIANTFQGTIHLFTSFLLFYNAGNHTKAGDFSRHSIYGKNLSHELKKQGRTYVGAQKPVVNRDISALMQAAKVVQDPRLLIIERTSGAGKVSIASLWHTQAHRRRNNL